MKKIKISELPLYQSLKGLFVMGTDVNNRSVKVSLEFIGTDTTTAIQNAEKAATEAIKAKDLAAEATKNATAAAEAAKKAGSEVTAIGKTASDAAMSAQNSSGQAEKAALAASKAAAEAEVSKKAADIATDLSNKATEAANKATKAAEAATEKVIETIGIIVPTALNVSCPERLTFGNVEPVYIKAVLLPETAMQNLIFLSDNKAVEVGTDGRLTVVSSGRSRVHVIPTCNTALAKTFVIEVGAATLRLVKRSQMRFTQAGALRMN